MQKHRFSITYPVTLFLGSAPGHQSMKNSVSMFHAQMQLNALRYSWIAPDVKTQVRRNMSHHAFSKIHTEPSRAWKIVSQCVVARTHQNALCDPQITPDAKTQVQCNVSYQIFSRIYTEHTRAWKIMCQRFIPLMHYNELCDPQITLDAQTQVWHNVSRCTFYWIYNRPTGAWKIVSSFHAPNAPECSTLSADRTECKNISSA
jgi:hypothetical protein